MEQLILHLFGDYILQTNWMATEKVKKSFAAFAHALVLFAPFSAAPTVTDGIHGDPLDHTSLIAIAWHATSCLPRTGLLNLT